MGRGMLKKILHRVSRTNETPIDESDNRPYRVLTIDGGGMRGLYTSILLETLEKQFAKNRGLETLDIGKAFDLIVGTSTGAFIAIGLALGVPIREVTRLYRDFGPKVFQDPVPNQYAHNGSILSLWAWAIRNWRKPANHADILREALLPYLGDMTLGEAYEKRNIGLCIPAVNMATHRGVLFKTPHNPHRTRYSKYKLIDVCLASISAPILFSLTTIDDPDDPEDYKVFIDGGLWANNPVLVGMTDALRMAKNKRPIEIVSVGTCDPVGGTFISKKNTEWGLNEWRVGTRVLSLALEAQSSANNEMALVLAKHLKNPCKIIRILQSPPSSDQEKYLVMDQATPETLKVLSDLAKQDAENIYRRAIEQQDEDLVTLAGIFDGMPSNKLAQETQNS